MKKIFLCSLAAALCLSAAAEDLVKTGLNVGPLPAIAYDADKGVQVGAIIQLFDYGDGHNYPNYDSKTYFEYSFFTKGSHLIQVRHDNKELIPGVRWSTALRINLDKAYDFYGFNGYQSYFDYASVIAGKDKKSDAFMYTPFYRYKRYEYLLKSDFLGKITPNLRWEGGVFVNYFQTGSIDYANINKGISETKAFPEGMPTMYDYYTRSGVISAEEANGGIASGFRAGMVYDSRDKEGAPSKGIWAEGHITGALPGISKIPYARYSLTFRHYVPIVKNDILTFAYRLNYEGSISKDTPFYALPYMTVMGEKSDLEGMGGYNTVRGIMRTRVVGLDMATYNAEMRWRFVKFMIGKQNIALALNAFSDGTMVTRKKDISALNSLVGTPTLLSQQKEIPHITFGAGFRFIMNENFIVAVEYGTPLTHFLKNSLIYNQDGTGAFYVNIGYLF